MTEAGLAVLLPFQRQRDRSPAERGGLCGCLPFGGGFPGCWRQSALDRRPRRYLVTTVHSCCPVALPSTVLAIILKIAAAQGERLMLIPGPSSTDTCALKASLPMASPMAAVILGSQLLAAAAAVGKQVLTSLLLFCSTPSACLAQPVRAVGQVNGRAPCRRSSACARCPCRLPVRCSFLKKVSLLSLLYSWALYHIFVA